MLILDANFIRNRITALRMQKGISEREMSLALGRGHGYIHNTVSGGSLPQMESFIEICDYLGVTPAEFFDVDLDNPTQVKEIYNELKRLCKGDMQMLVKILKYMQPNHLQALMDYMTNYDK